MWGQSLCSHLKRCLRIKQQHSWETKWGFFLALSLQGVSDMTFFCQIYPEYIVRVMKTIISKDGHKNSHHYGMAALYQALCWANYISFNPYSEKGGISEVLQKAELRLRAVTWNIKKIMQQGNIRTGIFVQVCLTQKRINLQYSQPRSL